MLVYPLGFFLPLALVFVLPAGLDTCAAMPALAKVRLMPACCLMLLGCVWHQIDVVELKCGERNLDGLEVFCGNAELTWGCLDAGLNFLGMDICTSNEHDVLSLEGLQLLLTRVMKIKEKGLLWAGTECKTWVFIDRHGTGRDKEHIGGNVMKKRIHQANHLVAITTLVFIVPWLRGVACVLENPQGSWIAQMEPLKSWLIFLKGDTEPTGGTSLGAFGAETPNR